MAAYGSRALDTSSTSTLVFCRLDSLVLLNVIEYESNIGAVSGYYRIDFRHEYRKAGLRRHRLCRLLRDRHLTRVCHCDFRLDFRRDYRRCHGHRCCYRAARRRCNRCSCDLDFRRCRRCCRASLRGGALQSLVSVFASLARRNVRGACRIPPDTNTRRRAADRRA